MKNPLMFDIYQVSKIKFSCPVTLISINPVKPAGSCSIQEDTFICISFYWLTCRAVWESFMRRWDLNQTLKELGNSEERSSFLEE